MPTKYDENLKVFIVIFNDYGTFNLRHRSFSDRKKASRFP